MPRHSRFVGQGALHTCRHSTIKAERRLAIALKWLSPDATPPVPWYRVLASNGTISSRGPGTDGAQRQREALEAEGVEVIVGRSGEMRVDLGRWGWFPAVGSVDTGVAAGGEDDQTNQEEDPEEQNEDEREGEGQS